MIEIASAGMNPVVILDVFHHKLSGRRPIPMLHWEHKNKNCLPRYLDSS